MIFQEASKGQIAFPVEVSEVRFRIVVLMLIEKLSDSVAKSEN
jgi:hypothetical protein